jgi:hypothetical protein
LVLLRCEIAWSVDRLARRIVGIIGWRQRWRFTSYSFAHFWNW